MAKSIHQYEVIILYVLHIELLLYTDELYKQDRWIWHIFQKL